MSKVPDLINEIDWDYLAILDSLRYDFANKIIDKDFKKVKSPATCTDHWLWMFSENVDLSNIVFITGNPRLKKNGIEGKYREDVWDWGWEKVDNVLTCPPWNVNKGFRKAYKIFGDEYKYVLWYVQPHFPYIGDIKMGTEICDFPEEDEMTSREEVTSPLRVWAEKCGAERVREAYQSNAKLVWESICELEKEGKWVVTSDHGELLGEHDIWGHYDDVDFQELREVPWVELN